MTAPLVEMRGVSKAFGGVHAVERADFNLDAGEAVGLVGFVPSGIERDAFLDQPRGRIDFDDLIGYPGGHVNAGLAINTARSHPSCRRHEEPQLHHLAVT